MIAGSANAASYSDADGDGVCEVGEVITFEGDISYIDENGNEHFFQSWYWDFNGDGVWEENGRVKTHTFDTVGVYTVKLYEINAAGQLITFEIDVKESNDNPGSGDDDDDEDDGDDDDPEDDDDEECKHRYRIWQRIKRFLRRHPRLRHRLRWIIQRLMMRFKCKCDN